MGGEGAIPSHSSGTLGWSFKGKNRTQKEFQKEGDKVLQSSRPAESPGLLRP